MLRGTRRERPNYYHRQLARGAVGVAAAMLVLTGCGAQPAPLNLPQVPNTYAAQTAAAESAAAAAGALATPLPAVTGPAKRLTTPLQGVDYSRARPGAVQIRKAGYTFAVRYLLSRYPDAVLQTSELQELQASHLAVVLVSERNPTIALGGFSKGMEDARAALKQATAVGLPASDLKVYFAVDFGPDAAQMKTVMQYLQGADSVLGVGRVGVYGSYYVLHQALAQHLVHYTWQTIAWSDGKLEPSLTMLQNHQDFGGGADKDQAYYADYGQVA